MRNQPYGVGAIDAHDVDHIPALANNDLHGLTALRSHFAGALLADGQQVDSAFVGRTEAKGVHRQDITARGLRNRLQVSAIDQGVDQLVRGGAGKVELLGDLGNPQSVVRFEEEFEDIQASAQGGSGDTTHSNPFLGAVALEGRRDAVDYNHGIEHRPIYQT